MNRREDRHADEGRRVDRTDEGYERLFAAEYPHVRRTVYVMTRDASVAEDVTQDAFVQLLLHWAKVSRYDRPDAWVRRVAIRLAVRHMKREGRRQVLESQWEPMSPSPEHDPDLVAAIRDLPVKQQAVLVLFYFEDRPMKEIAADLGMSESTGFVHLHRARRRLEQVLGEVSADVVGQ